jgi:hypothetical protein
VLKLNIPPELHEFEVVLLRLQDLHLMTSCELVPANFDSVIDSFHAAWVKLGDKFKISTTNKLHVIFDHLSDYYYDTELSLRKVSDELVEHMHHFFHRRLSSSYNVKDVSNPQQGKQLFKCVCHCNTYNITVKK